VSLQKTAEVVPLRLAANPLGALRFRLVLVMMASYFAMMAFVIHTARHAAETDRAVFDFSPAMIALAICMAFSVILTGFFVLVRHED
jgi:hypothetical protein